MKHITAAEIASLVDGELKGDPSLIVNEAAPLDIAEQSAVSFLSNPKYRKLVVTSKAGVLILPFDFEGEPPRNTAWIHVEEPNTAFSKIVMQLVDAPQLPIPGIHADASISPDASLGQNVHIGPQAVVGAGTTIGDNTIVEAGCVIGAKCIIGSDCRFHFNVSICDGCVIGNRVVIHCNSVVGSDGYGYEPDLKGHRKVPQLGIVQIDDDVEIGACTTVDRARFGKTWIQEDVKIDNLCQVAHNVVIGKGSFLMGQAGVAGSAHLGKYVAIFGRAAVPGHIHIGDFAKIMGGSSPINDVPEHSELVGYPAVDRKQFFRQVASVKRLPSLMKRVRALEARIDQLEDQPEGD
jgi:UDP-3-O-[3-hydroxymyristoyl] glucosamine N-acyltransferase